MKFLVARNFIREFHCSDHGVSNPCFICDNLPPACHKLFYPLKKTHFRPHSFFNQQCDFVKPHR